MEDKKTTYHESQKKAIMKYKQSDHGKLKINELSKKYYSERKHNEEFIQKTRERARAYYHKKKQERQQEQDEKEKIILIQQIDNLKNLF